jgi:hypothetical protein
MAYTAANPSGVKVGTITFTANGSGNLGTGAFSSVNNSTVFSAGDQFSFQFSTTNLSQMSVAMRGSYT